jgi:hypothetical protein
MNGKQRVLTVIALIAFVVIGAFHYLEWPPIMLFGQRLIPYTRWEELTWKEAASKTNYRYVTGNPMLPYFQGAIKRQLAYEESMGLHNRYTADGKRTFTDAEVGIPRDDAKAWVPIETEMAKTIWNPHFNGTDPPYAMIPDVRMPWFMLGVIYAGLFFLLADKKEKKQ